MFPRPPSSTLFPYTTLFRSSKNPRSPPRCFASSSSEYLLTMRSEEHTSELQSRGHLVCRLLLEKKKPNLLPGRPSVELPKLNSGGREAPRTRIRQVVQIARV